MPLTDALILFGIITAFTVFGLTLAWGEYQTRNLASVQKPKNAIPLADQAFKKAA